MELTKYQLDMWVTMLRATASINRRLAADMLETDNIHISWFDVLVHLYHAPDHTLRMHELADQIIMSSSGLTRLLDRMVEAGLIDRQSCAEDRRVVFAILTEVGRQQIEALIPRHQARVATYFMQFLSAEEVDVLYNTFARVLAQSGTAFVNTISTSTEL